MEQQIGPEAKLKAAWVDGKIRLSIDYDGKQLDAGAYISADSDQLVDVLLGLVPGDSTLEQTVGALLKSALKNVKI